jgi:RND family efflux transporter MFP subunit
MARKISFFLALALLAGGIFYVLAGNKKKLEEKIEKPIVVDQIPVKTAVAIKKPLTQHLTLLGTVVPHNDVMVMSETQGRVVAIYKEKGDAVRKGEIIADVDRELKDANLSAVEAQLEKARTDLKRLEELLKQDIGTASQVEAARLQVKTLESQLVVARRQVSDSRIAAPIGGILYERQINMGTMLAPGTPVGQIVDMSILKLTVSVPEADVFKLKVGDRVSISCDVYPEAKLSGKVRMIAPKGDISHNFPVEIWLDNNPAYPLKAGVFARAHFVSLPKRESILIPREALTGSIKEPQVFVVENGIARLVSVSVGGDEGNLIEIASGIQENQEVVVNGQINLKDGVKVAPTKGVQ